MAPTLTLTLGQEDFGVTPTSTTQRRAFDLISAGLGPGVNGPLLVAAEFESGGRAERRVHAKKLRGEAAQARSSRPASRGLEKKAAALQ